MTMEKELPEGWVEAPIGELCQLFNGRAFKKTEWSKTGLPIIRIQNLNTPNATFNHFNGDLDNKHFVRNGDLLFAWSGTPGTSFGAHEWPGGDAALNQHIFKISFSEREIYKPFFKYAINQKLDELIGSANGGVGLRHVTKGSFEKTRIFFPPLAEQQVIADKLDALLAQVATTKTRLERVPETIKRFRQSVLAAAVSGKLTEEWRGSKSAPFAQPPITIGQEKSECPDGWEWNKLIDLARLESGHTPRKSIQEYWEGGDVPWISLQDIRAAHGTVIAKTKFMPTKLGIENSSARLLPKGTVCFSRDISVGYTTIMGTEMATTQHFVNWICTEELNNHYLMYAFMASKDHLAISGQGTTVKTLYMPACKQFRLLTPPLPEQQEIVRRIEELFAHADAVEQQAKAALEKVNNLTQSILAKAFRGELTADWRAANPELISGENSAEALLARIKEERAAQKPKKRATTRRKKKVVSD